MRTKSIIDVLLPWSRQAVLSVMLPQPERSWYMADLARHLRVRPSSLQRELAALTAAGILKTHRQGRMVYFQADETCPVYPELRGLLVKTSGLTDILRQALAPFAKHIKLCFVFGSIARTEEHSASDVDLMVIGEVSLSEIAESIRKSADVLGREVNPKIYRPGEFAKKIASHDHFLENVLKKPKLFIYGTQDELDHFAL